jgi:zinc transporter ZupT
LWRILKKDFDDLMVKCPGLQSVFDASCRERIIDLGNKKIISAEETARWAAEAMNHTDDKYFLPSQEEIRNAASEKQKSAAALAIWLGLLLDGIPESLVIGINMIQSTVSIALIGGLFLSNLPESMSSAIIMKRQRTSVSRIMLMWCSLVVITGIGAFLGSTFFINAPSFTIAFFEGFAAGAMLCMIAETMLPEAYEQGGTIVGISTLLGFLATIYLSSLQH